jgi:hypothetical protein
MLKGIETFVKRNKKLFIYSNIEEKRLLKILNLNSKKSIKGFKKFVIYLRQHTSLFTNI